MPADLSTPQARIAYLARLGIRVPLRPVMSAGRTIVDADDHVVAVILPTGGTTLDRARSGAIAAAINAWCGIEEAPDLLAAPEPLPALDPYTEAKIADPCDPRHLQAVSKQSQVLTERLHRKPEAAE